MTETNYADLWEKQSKLLWSRLQALLVFNGAVLAGWWKIKNDFWIEVPFLFIASLISSILLGIIQRDSKILCDFKFEAIRLKQMKDFGEPEEKGTCLAKCLGWIPLAIYGILAISVFPRLL